MFMSENELTSQTRAAVVVFPTPGGPDNNAALNPEPSSLLPNFPNLAAFQKDRDKLVKQNFSLNSALE